MYALNNIVTSGTTDPVTDCYTSVTVTMMYPFVFISMSEKVTIDNAPYPNPVEIAEEPVMSFVGALPNALWPKTNAFISVVVNETGPIVGALLVNTSGRMSIWPHTVGAEAYLYAFAGMYRID